MFKFIGSLSLILFRGGYGGARVVFLAARQKNLLIPFNQAVRNRQNSSICPDFPLAFG
jgi:hypothetical protein